MRIGMGLGASADPARSARDAARQAKKTCPRPTLALAFGSINLDQRKIHSALCQELDPAILLGGSSFGEITTAGATKGTVAVLLVELDGASARFADASAAKGSARAGEELARRLARGPAEGAIGLGLLFSAISDFEGNSGLDALRSKLGCLPYFGGMTCGDYDLGLSHPDFRRSWQYGETLAEEGARLALLELPPDAHSVAFGFEHGWSPVGPVATITRGERNKVFEVDGLPVLDYYRQFLCDEEGQRFFEQGIQRFAFAMQLEGEYEGSSLIKLPVVCDFKEGSVQYNPAEELEGRRVRLVLGSRSGLVDGARRAAQRCLAALGGADPALVLAVSCCTRAAILHSRMDLEVGAVRGVFGPRVPVFGFYAGGEIAPFLSRYEDAQDCDLKFSGSYHHATTIALLAIGAVKRPARVAMPARLEPGGGTLRAENVRLRDWLSKGEAVLDDHEAFLASLSRKSYEDGEKLAKQTDIIRRYTPHEVWKEIGSNAERGEYELADCSLDAGFLFMDVKGYTSFSESHSPAEIVAALNGIFEPATRLVYDCGGDVDKYIGDALFASFRRPEDAVTAAARLLALVAEGAREGSPFSVRVGVNAGKAVRANVGSAARREYTFIGDAVNTAQRLEANCEPGHALVGASLEEAARKAFRSVVRRELTVKGKAIPVVAFDCSI
jgi:class 3 adenylate cyclase